MFDVPGWYNPRPSELAVVRWLVGLCWWCLILHLITLVSGGYPASPTCGSWIFSPPLPTSSIDFIHRSKHKEWNLILPLHPLVLILWCCRKILFLLHQRITVGNKVPVDAPEDDGLKVRRLWLTMTTTNILPTSQLLNVVDKQHPSNQLDIRRQPAIKLFWAARCCFHNWIIWRGTTRSSIATARP